MPTDNASGSAANLSIAELMMAAHRAKRSLIFIWDSGEEQGRWGTRHFVGNPPVPLERGSLTTTGIHDRYHLPSDEASALDPKKMERIARTIFASAWAHADAVERPRIDKPSPIHGLALEVTSHQLPVIKLQNPTEFDIVFW